jgi:hypothetical protein
VNGCTVRLVDFCRPAAVLNLKQPAEILPKKTKTGNHLSKFKDCRKEINHFKIKA